MHEPSPPRSAGYATADLVDRFEEELRSCPLQFRDYGGRLRFFGAVRTLMCKHDNALLKEIVSQSAVGPSVLVVDGGGSLESALVGDVIAALAARNGWAGLIIHGAVRDVERLREVDIGLKALGANPLRSGKTRTGAIDLALTLGGVPIAPGDWVYCDSDGVIIACEPIHLRASS